MERTYEITYRNKLMTKAKHNHIYERHQKLCYHGVAAHNLFRKSSGELPQASGTTCFHSIATAVFLHPFRAASGELPEASGREENDACHDWCNSGLDFRARLSFTCWGALWMLRKALLELFCSFTFRGASGKLLGSFWENGPIFWIFQSGPA